MRTTADHHNTITTLKKLRCLEAYLAADSTAADAVLDSSLTKLLAREQVRMQRLAQRLRQDLRRFETAHRPESFRRLTGVDTPIF